LVKRAAVAGEHWGVAVGGGGEGVDDVGLGVGLVAGGGDAGVGEDLLWFFVRVDVEGEAVRGRK
jgi:hypothetical protein